MIITIAGMAGSGKSTAAALLAKKLGYRHFSAGDFMREIATGRELSLLEISKVAEKDRSIDEELDARTTKLGVEQDNFVLDSRLGYHFIPKSFTVFLDVDDTEAARRIFSDIQDRKKSRRVEKESISLQATLRNLRQRRESEVVRYEKYYGLNPFDKRQYDLVIDTTHAAPDEVVAMIAAALRKKFPKQF